MNVNRIKYHGLWSPVGPNQTNALPLFDCEAHELRAAIARVCSWCEVVDHFAMLRCDCVTVPVRPGECVEVVLANWQDCLEMRDACEG